MKKILTQSFILFALHIFGQTRKPFNPLAAMTETEPTKDFELNIFCGAGIGGNMQSTGFGYGTAMKACFNYQMISVFGCGSYGFRTMWTGETFKSNQTGSCGIIYGPSYENDFISLSAGAGFGYYYAYYGDVKETKSMNYYLEGYQWQQASICAGASIGFTNENYKLTISSYRNFGSLNKTFVVLLGIEVPLIKN